MTKREADLTKKELRRKIGEDSMSDILFKLPGIYESAMQRYAGIMESKNTGEYEVIEEMGNSESSIAFGDNIKYMKYLLDKGYGGKIDMIYIDPPFFSKSDYTVNIKVGSSKRKLILAKNRAFTDKWELGMAEYLENMTVALLMMKSLLSDTGSIFVHLDWHSSHYMKIMLDQIFGENNFINEIVWNYKSGGVSNRYFARKHDVVLFYSKTKNYFFEAQKEKSYNRGLKPYHFKGVKEYKDEVGWYTLVNMKDVWQIDMVGRTSSERTGYATQKPEALIERIMRSVTSEGDLCADFFCGSGTLGAVCAKLGRKYIMCDNSAPAVMMAHKRLSKEEVPHALLREKRKISKNFSADIAVEKIDGVIESTGITIKGVSYENLRELGIDEKNGSLMETILKNHYDQLIEYWCVDTDYDGKTVRPKAYSCREKDDIDLAAVIPTKQIKRLAVRVIDVFGNEFTFAE